MAAVSAPQATSALTPPSSSHGGHNAWNYSVPQEQTLTRSRNNSHDYTKRNPLTSQTNGNISGHQNTRPALAQRRANTSNSSNSSRSNQAMDTGYLAPGRADTFGINASSISETGSAPDSLLDLYGNKSTNGMETEESKGIDDASDNVEDPEHSRWIHRDKLARIESEELQAAGIILPRARGTSKSSRRDRSRDQSTPGFRAEQAGRRQIPTGETFENGGWDLRLPEEAAEANESQEYYRDISGGLKGVSRIPVAKTSPMPIPVDFLERDTPVRRKMSTGQAGDEDVIAYSKTRGRSQSIKPVNDSVTPTPTPAKKTVPDTVSPTKKTVKKVTGGNRATSATQRPKTRSGTAREGNGPRPATRSGDFSNIRVPEGDPPWLATMYKPDPRLPPDQQLLPTVAKRLQQEQWEREGKFGNAYDKEFRPLNDEKFPEQPPEIIPTSPQTIEVPETKPEPEWPLRATKSPVPSTGRPGTSNAGSYSTMPKLQNQGNNKPQTPALPSPVSASQAPIRVPEAPEDTKKKGCGCCLVM